MDWIIGAVLLASLVSLIVALVLNVSGRKKPEVPYVPEVSEETLRKWLG